MLVTREDEIVKKYSRVMKQMLGITYQNLNQQDLDNAIMYSINKRYKEEPARVYNNYKEKNVNMNLYEIANYICERKPIITAYGVMFQQHGQSPNPFSRLFYLFMQNREIHKKKMFTFPPGSEEYENLDLVQLLDKLDANGLYGAAGAGSCIFFNLHVAASITTQGRSSISAATMFFEMFMNNNVQFRSLDEVIVWINNVINERPNRKYNDKEILDFDVTPGDAFGNIAKACTWDWTPTFEEMDIVYDILRKLDQEDINRIYYKNNLFDFCNNFVITELIKEILIDLEEPFYDPNKPPKIIKDKLNKLLDLFREYVFYNYQIIDKIDRTLNMIKKTIIVTDTDSAIVCLDGWYQFILEKVKGIRMNITKLKLDMVKKVEYDEFGDPKTHQMVELVEPELDYDFYNDEIIELEKAVDMVKIIPQDGVRYSIINILAYCLGTLCNEYLEGYCRANHSDINNPYGRCMLYLKNEFLFKSILLTDVKKHYVAIQELREGHFNNNKLAITGLDIDRTTLNEEVKVQMQKIIYEDILNSGELDQIKILKELNILEKKIIQSLESGSKDFYKPATIRPLNHYKNPMQVQGIKASVVWNSIKTLDLPGINLDETNSIDIVKVNITPKTIEKIKDKYSELYEKLSELFKDKVYKNEITSLAIPKDLDIIPEWIKEFIDYLTIANDNLSAFPLESIGLTRMNGVNSNNVNFTNILTL